jgi:hypothetical protein
VETKKNGCVRITKNSGNHVAQLKESYNIKGLITGATYLHKKIIALSGYNKTSPFIYLLYDYNSNFFSGNKKD